MLSRRTEAAANSGMGLSGAHGRVALLWRTPRGWPCFWHLSELGGCNSDLSAKRRRAHRVRE
eukprot:1510094-Alexandrium_andersonii.AAC.1